METMIKKIFSVKIEKEKVNKALEMTAVDDEIIKAHKEIGGKGKIESEVK